MKKTRVIALVVAAAMTCVIAFVPGTSTAHRRATRDSDFQRVRIHGHPVDHPNWTVRGHMNVSRFVLRNGEVRAVARITDAVLRRPNGNVVRRLDEPQRVVIPVTLPTSGGASTAGNDVSIAATCRILDLVLGPLDLDLLGLKVHLNRVVLNIVAESGPGNLLGNLLCAIAGLLDGTPALQDVLDAIVDLLNGILAGTRL
jgi:hypothetical protein